MHECLEKPNNIIFSSLSKIMADVDSNSWKVLADKKEKEWKGILESRYTLLNKSNNRQL